MVYDEPVDELFSEDDDIYPKVDPWESNMKQYENERKEKEKKRAQQVNEQPKSKK